MHVNITFLRNWKKDGKKIALYCAGTHGKLIAGILRKLDIEPDFFLDNSQKKWDTVIEGLPCYEPAKFSDREDVLVFVCIEMQFYSEVTGSVKQKGFSQIADITDVFDDLILHYREEYLKLIEKFATVEEEAGIFYCLSPNEQAVLCDTVKEPVRERIAVYTGIFGNYDEICRPQIHPSNIDYYFISDERPEQIQPFQWINAKEVIPSDIVSPIKRNRYIKMHAHELFPQYQYSVYIDGNITLTADISDFVHHNRSGISAFMLPWRDCVYYEALAVVNDKRAAAGDVCRQVKRYLKEGMPLHYGLPEMPVIAMEHTKRECIQVMETWWQEFVSGAQRDQLSFMYAMWKNGLCLSDMTSLGGDVRQSSYLYKTKHPSKSKQVVNTD